MGYDHSYGYGSYGYGAGMLTRPRSDSLADLLERVLDKGVVIAGDVIVNVVDVELLSLKVRLLICSADTAQRMGIDWWKSDPFLNSGAAALERENVRRENRELRRRVRELEELTEERHEALPDRQREQPWRG